MTAQEFLTHTLESIATGFAVFLIVQFVMGLIDRHKPTYGAAQVEEAAAEADLPTYEEFVELTPTAPVVQAETVVEPVLSEDPIEVVEEHKDDLDVLGVRDLYKIASPLKIPAYKTLKKPALIAAIRQRRAALV